MRPYHWPLVISLLTTMAYAEQQPTTQDQRVGEGLMLSLKGEKEKAWNILFPEAKAGNVIAMYHLGVLMLRSTEYPDHLERAKKFFSAAADRGHKGSAAMLKQVEALMATAGAPPTIGGTSGIPLPKDIESAKAAYAKVQAQIAKFQGPQPTIPPQVTVKAFISDNSGTVKDLIEMSEQTKVRFGDKVEFQFFVLIDPETWDPKQVFTPASGSMPIVGFRPDLNGEEARKYGVRTTPAVVLVPENGNARIINNTHSLISELSMVLR
ncbi:sel1 repeat family protein [Pseudomonas sp. NPDC089569]|uniref:sel1 repeat family protein n=1 Tax=Pseudomonas sp. NPDC089569 TaxID=3390722 RepID=UPI003CFE3697